MKRLACSLALTAALALTLTSSAAFAQESPTLQKIKQEGAITIGYRESSIPFSYLDDKQQPIGFSMDLCARIVDALKTELKMPNLQVKLIPVTPATRVPLISNATVDMECGSTTNTIDRQKQVSFLYTTYLTGTKLLVRKADNVKSIADLRGKSIAVTSGTNNIRFVQAAIDKDSLGISLMNAKDHAESFLLVQSGRAAGFATDDVLLYSLRASSRVPADFEIVGPFLSVEPYGIMVRRDDPAFKKFGDGVLVTLFNNGDFEKIFNKWFLAPIPPKGVNLNIPLPDQLRDIMRNPNDRGA
jgi:glutamate/aspartate transport system substrate-binding protein